MGLRAGANPGFLGDRLGLRPAEAEEERERCVGLPRLRGTVWGRVDSRKPFPGKGMCSRSILTPAHQPGRRSPGCPLDTHQFGGGTPNHLWL